MRYLSTFRDHYGTPRAWAFGATVAEANRKARTVLDRYIADCRELGDPLADSAYSETVSCVPSS